jgi:hypothetical protein
MKPLLLLLASLFLASCGFESRLVASPTADGKFWVVEKPLRYRHPKTNELHEVPRGFATDLASVPRLFWSAFPPCGNYTPAAVVHDYLYWEQPAGMTREAADKILLTAMEESDVKWTTRQAIYRAVRVGGQSAWDGNNRLKRSGESRRVPENLMNFAPDLTWEQLERRIPSAR